MRVAVVSVVKDVVDEASVGLVDFALVASDVDFGGCVCGGVSECLADECVGDVDFGGEGCPCVAGPVGGESGEGGGDVFFASESAALEGSDASECEVLATEVVAVVFIVVEDVEELVFAAISVDDFEGFGFDADGVEFAGFGSVVGYVVSFDGAEVV